MTAALALRQSLTALMTDQGRTMTVRRDAQGTYDPATGAAPTGAITTYNAKGRLGDYSDAVKDGTLIQQFDRRCTIVFDDATFVPAAGDTLLVGSDAYSVVAVKERELGGVFIGFTMQVRR